MNTDAMNQAGVVTFTGVSESLEFAADDADEKMNSFLQDRFDRLVVGVSTQTLYVNGVFHCSITVLFRYKDEAL